MVKSAFLANRPSGANTCKTAMRPLAADLTFAALLAPALLLSRAEGYGATLPALEELLPDARQLIAETRASRAGAFALEMFQDRAGR